MLRIAGFENLSPTIQRFPDKYAHIGLLSPGRQFISVFMFSRTGPRYACSQILRTKAMVKTKRDGQWVCMFSQETAAR